MLELVFATSNKNKIAEIQLMLPPAIQLLGLHDIGCTEEIPETQPTLEGNASQKAHYVFEKYGYDCFADDTGLEIKALDGRPGVYSARYAGEQRDSENNMQKVLTELKNTDQREAQFRTVISLIQKGKEQLFEGIAKGSILHQKQGAKGFGYDPIFQPDAYDHSFAELSMEEKNSISHRGKAFQKLIAYLRDCT